MGDGFILPDICIENTAEPMKQQAVAQCWSWWINYKLKSNKCLPGDGLCSLFSTILSWQFHVGHSWCHAAVMFQNCSLVSRLPLSYQQNLMTAQGRMDPNQNTGTSIQICQAILSSELMPVEASTPTYLGRTWKTFSRTVYMQSYINSHTNPKGWL